MVVKDVKINEELSDTIIVSCTRYLLSKECGDRGNSLHNFHLPFVEEPLSTAYLKHGDFPDPSLCANTAGHGFGR